jgi:dihydropteroate synthase
MQQSPLYGDVVTEVREELRERVDVFLRAGVERENIVIDPGIGFGKRGDDNLLLIRNLQVFAEMGFAVLVGTSRKSFIGQITGKPVEQRLWGTLGSAAVALMNGAKVFRVHDVAETVDCLAVVSAILGAADPVNRSISKAASPVA